MNKTSVTHTAQETHPTCEAENITPVDANLVRLKQTKTACTVRTGPHLRCALAPIQAALRLASGGLLFPCEFSLRPFARISVPCLLLRLSPLRSNPNPFPTFRLRPAPTCLKYVGVTKSPRCDPWAFHAALNPTEITAFSQTPCAAAIFVWRRGISGPCDD